jgi:hypothetical protein
MAKTTQLKGNKGEWSEIYVFLKLLAEGKLHAADANLNAIPTIYYPIIKILRQETGCKIDYVLDGNIKVYKNESEYPLLEIPISEFVKNSRKLFTGLQSSSGASMQFPEIENFLNSIEVSSVSAVKHNKADIRLVIHDFNTGSQHKLGFSIKSLVGGDATLFNPQAGTNFIFEVQNLPGDFDVEEFNRYTLERSLIKPRISKISYRITELERLGYSLVFKDIQSENLRLNLEIIDTQLPEIVAYLLLYKFKTGVSYLADLIEVLNQNNPLNFNLSRGHPFYDVKVRALLTESALGMTPQAVWTGIYEATGGIILVKDTGDLVCYHIYDRNDFQEYLVNHTKLDQASTSENKLKPGSALEKVKGVKKSIKDYKYGWLYKEDERFFFKLNLQIRFM